MVPALVQIHSQVKQPVRNRQLVVVHVHVFPELGRRMIVPDSDRVRNLCTYRVRTLYIHLIFERVRTHNTE